MKKKIAMSSRASTSAKESARTKIHRDLGSRATITGDEILVDHYESKKVTDILDRERVEYSVSH